MRENRTRVSKKSGLTFRRPTTTSIFWTSSCALFAQRFAWASALLCCLTSGATAQERPIVDQVRFAGSPAFADAELAGRIRTTPNRRVFGIGGATWWLWLYRLGEKGTFGRRVSRGLMASGEPPAWLDSTTVEADADQLQDFLVQEGFRTAAVTYRTVTAGGGMRTSVIFEIAAGPATFIRRIRYEGLGALDAASQRKLVEASLLPSVSGTLVDYQAAPLRFSESLLVEERRRMLSLLRDAGYAAVSRDSITARVLLHSADSVDVVLQVRTGPRYRYGSIHFEVEGPQGLAPAEQAVETGADTLFTYRMDPSFRIAPSLLRHALRMRPGEVFSATGVQQTKQRLESTGVFSFTDIVSEAASGSLLPHRITVRTRPRHQFETQTFVLQSSGFLSGAGTELGGGLGASYENVNLFGRGETMRLSGTAALLADRDSASFASSQAEVSASLTLPYLAGPFGNLESALDLHQARTRITLSLLTARREDLRLLLRGRGTARFRMEMQHAPGTMSLIDLVDISLSNPDTLRGFKSRFLDRILGTSDTVLVTDPVQRAQVLEDYTHPQINNALRYTFRTENVHPLRRNQGYSYEAAIEVGGNLPYLLDRYVYSPGTVERSLPGLPLLRASGGRDRMNYRQYVRAVVDLRRYLRLGVDQVLALKALGGWAHPLGQARNIPFFRRFFSGGASSVRGWHLRALGPGGASFTRSAAGNADATNILGGDIKLEFSVELRQRIAQKVLGAEWIAAGFTDAGNVWFGPRNPGFANLTPGAPDGHFAFDTFVREIGVGSGVGLRLFWPYLVARLDVAYRARDPSVPRAPWWPAGLRDPVVYFRFGHTF